MTFKIVTGSSRAIGVTHLRPPHPASATESSGSARHPPPRLALESAELRRNSAGKPRREML